MKRTELLLTVAMVVAAVSIAVAAVKRSFFGGAVRVSVEAEKAVSAPINDSLWSKARHLSRAAGEESEGPLVIVADDFECPACKEFHRRLRDLQAAHPRSFQLRIIHFPLSYHRFALPAARLSECVSSDVEFGRLVDELYAAQDSLGLLEWEVLLRRAAVGRVAEVAECSALPDDAPQFTRLREGRQLADRIGVSATPTVMVDGAKLSRPPSDAELRELLGLPK